jgi:ABC-type lipoprotein release transport system permease subunit
VFRLIVISARNLLRHRRRTFLVGSAIGAVTLLLVCLLGLMNSLRSNLYESTTTYLSGQVNVSGIYKPKPGRAVRLIVHPEEAAKVIRATLPDVDYLGARVLGTGSVSSDTATLPSSTQLVGVDIANERGLREVVRVLHGDLKALGEKNTILLFEEQAKRLGVSVGDRITLGGMTLRRAHNAVDVRVAVVAANGGAFTRELVLIPNETLRELYGLRPDSASMLQVHLRHPVSDLQPVEDALRKALAAGGDKVLDEDHEEWGFKKEQVEAEPWTGQRIDVTRWQDEVMGQSGLLDALDTLIGILTFLMLTIACVGLMNSLWLAIRERTNEIGTLRAIGMGRMRVTLMFFFEAVLIGVFSAVAGALLAVGLGLVVNALQLTPSSAVQVFLGMGDHLQLEWRTASIVHPVELIIVCCSLVSIFPSYLASRLRPITAIHHIG